MHVPREGFLNEIVLAIGSLDQIGISYTLCRTFLPRAAFRVTESNFALVLRVVFAWCCVPSFLDAALSKGVAGLARWPLPIVVPIVGVRLMRLARSPVVSLQCALIFVLGVLGTEAGPEAAEGGEGVPTKQHVAADVEEPKTPAPPLRRAPPSLDLQEVGPPHSWCVCILTSWVVQSLGIRKRRADDYSCLVCFGP